MTVTGRYYLFAADGLHRLSKRVLEGLINVLTRFHNTQEQSNALHR